jgi:acetylornithine deacetylase/succinyl-diaminopimelate desuccinylase-like protein
VHDPGAQIAPYMLSGGTDAKSFATVLGMRCYGFAPLRLPPELDFASLFHGIDERVPVDALQFGTRVLDEFLRTC